MNIYEKLKDLIPEVKMIENEDTKKRLTFKLKDLMNEIHTLKEEYDSLDPSKENLFFQKKQQMEEKISLSLEEIENTIKLNNEETPNKTM